MKQMTFEEAYLKIITEGELFTTDDNFTSKYKKNTKIFANITVEPDGMSDNDPFKALLEVFRRFKNPKPISDLESELEEFKKKGVQAIETKYPPEKKGTPAEQPEEGENKGKNTPANASAKTSASITQGSGAPPTEAPKSEESK